MSPWAEKFGFTTILHDQLCPGSSPCVWLQNPRVRCFGPDDSRRESWTNTPPNPLRRSAFQTAQRAADFYWNKKHLIKHLYSSVYEITRILNWWIRHKPFIRDVTWDQSVRVISTERLWVDENTLYADTSTRSTTRGRHGTMQFEDMRCFFDVDLTSCPIKRTSPACASDSSRMDRWLSRSMLEKKPLHCFSKFTKSYKIQQTVSYREDPINESLINHRLRAGLMRYLFEIIKLSWLPFVNDCCSWDMNMRKNIVSKILSEKKVGANVTSVRRFSRDTGSSLL